MCNRYLKKNMNHFKVFQFCDLSGKLDKLNSHDDCDDGQVLLHRQGPKGQPTRSGGGVAKSLSNLATAPRAELE